MKTLIILLILTFIISCNDDDKITNPSLFKSEGIIIGQDFRKCFCCGGWQIIIKETTYRFSDIPNESGIILENEQLPISVKLDWQKDTITCGDEINVIRIQKK